MQINLYERNNRLYVNYAECGKRVRKSLNLKATKSNISYAYRVLIPKINQQLEKGINTKSDLSIRYFTTKILHIAKTELTPNTYKIYKTGVNKFFTFFEKTKEVSSFKIKDIDDYVVYLRLKKHKKNTIQTYLSPISIAFEEAVRLEIIDKNPTSHIKMPKKDKKETTPYNILQVQTMLREATGDLKTFLHIGFFTGARAGEILALKWQDIAKNTINIKATKHTSGTLGAPKSGKSRTILYPEPLKAYLSTLNKDGEFVINNNYCNIIRYFHKLLKSLGYKKQGLHSTRHTFASLLVQKNVSPTLIAKMLGHANLTMINNIYAKYIEGNDVANNAILNQALAQS